MSVNAGELPTVTPFIFVTCKLPVLGLKVKLAFLFTVLVTLVVAVE